jgi:spoIIIJ-associated protein
VTENQEINQSPKHPERSLQTVTQYCLQLITSLRMDLSLEGKEDSGILNINLTGPDRPYLLSGAASVLNSIEYLLNKIFHGSREDTPGIVVDSDGYRQHREAELTLLAQMASKKVLSLRKPLALQPMTPRERRIVHLAIAGMEGVRSESEGEGDHRSITIYPS